jgi:apolipoprotein N-acyltransferase
MFQNIAAWILAGLLIAGGYEYAGLWPIAIIGAAIFIWRIYASYTAREAFLGGWFVGTIYWAVITRWLFSVLPAEWLGLERDSAVLPLVFSIWILLSVMMGLASGLFASGIFALRHSFARTGLILAPSVWVLSEYLRAWFFSIFTAGSEALLGPHWTFGHLGYALVDSPFFRLAPFLGVYGLSWLVVFAGAAAAASLLRRQEALIGFAILTFIFGFLLWRQPAVQNGQKKIMAAAFQSDVRSGAVLWRDSVRAAIENYFRAYPGIAPPDIVVLPEDAALFSISQEEEKELLGRFFNDASKGGAVITSATVFENKKRVKYSYFIDKTGEIISRYPKNFLVPGGEFLPYFFKPLFWAFGRPQFAETFRAFREISAVEFDKPYIEANGVKFAVGICTSVLSPRIYRRMAGSGAEVLLNQTSFSVFHGSPLLLNEMIRMARFRAAENARPLIQAANTGESLIIDSNGNITARAPSLGNYIIAGTVIPNNAKTLTQRFGDWPVGFSALLTFIYVLFLPSFLARYLKNSI